MGSQAGGKGPQGSYLGIVDKEQLVVGHLQSWQLLILAAVRHPLAVSLQAPSGGWACACAPPGTAPPWQTEVLPLQLRALGAPWGRGVLATLPGGYLDAYTGWAPFPGIPPTRRPTRMGFCLPMLEAVVISLSWRWTVASLSVEASAKVGVKRGQSSHRACPPTARRAPTGHCCLPVQMVKGRSQEAPWLGGGQSLPC